MWLITDEIEKRIQKGIMSNITSKRYDLAERSISATLDRLYANIPDNKRASYGIVHAIKVLSERIYQKFREMKPVFQIASGIYDKSKHSKTRMVALGVLSFCGLDSYGEVLPYFEDAASSRDWNLREVSQMFFRKLIKKYPEQMRVYMARLAKSGNGYLRRFVGETLRPVQENKWFYEKPEYPLSVLRHLFRESFPYARTSVGNNLSDLARRLPNLIYGIVEQLVQSGDPNSYWIAYRSCRNLVKREPSKVMDLLKVEEYKYKTRIYKRND